MVRFIVAIRKGGGWVFKNYFKYIFSHAQLQDVHFHLPVPRGANSIVI